MEQLKARAELLAQVRHFLSGRGYWEVETPLLAPAVVVDAHIDPFEVAVGNGERAFLLTSPESFMKRLLAVGAGSIFQITRSFRHGERGPRHNPEFTIVEWYRTGGHYHQLMAEVGLLTSQILHVPEPRRLSYREAFEQYVGCDPFLAEDEQLQDLACQQGLAHPDSDRDDLLNFLLASLVEPQLGLQAPDLLVDYPASQAALARIRPGTPPVAERFELYVQGVEICNGYQELTSAEELRQRSKQQNAIRKAHGKAPLPVDELLLAAMDAGLPECTGVALGFDRLVMLATGARSLAEVTAFPQL